MARDPEVVERLAITMYYDCLEATGKASAGAVPLGLTWTDTTEMRREHFRQLATTALDGVPDGA